MFEKFRKSPEVIKHNPMEIAANNMILEFGYAMAEISPHGEDTETVFRFQPRIPLTENNERVANLEELETFAKHLGIALDHSDQIVWVTVENSPLGSYHIKMELVPENDQDIDENDLES